jgi:type VI secretion system protein ImpF
MTQQGAGSCGLTPCLICMFFELNLFDKLLDGESDRRGYQSVEQVKDSVARDVEALLNARCGLSRAALEPFPHVQRSVLSFGLTDFVSLSLSKEGDRALICDDIRWALITHEKRLRDPAVTVSVQEDSSQRLHFSIRALLVVSEANEYVSFDAVLQPNNLRYHVSRAR